MRPDVGFKIGILLLFVLDVCYGNASKIKISKFKLLTPRAEAKDLEWAFDNDQSTQALVHSRKDEEVITLLSFPSEYEINSVEIISDLPATLKQTVQVGYAQDNKRPSPSLLLNCEVNRTITICRPHCGHGAQGVTGTTILWTIQRSEETGWTRIYDVIIRGQIFESPTVTQDGVTDIALLKPYLDHGMRQDVPTCDPPLWKLIDSSPATASTTAVVSASRNLTVYFGQPYSVVKIGLITGQANEMTSDITLHFGGRKEVTHTVNLATDCTTESSDTGLHQCALDQLDGYPFTKVTFNAKGLVKFHVYGMPFYFPQIGIGASEKRASPESEKQLKLTCMVVSCGGNGLNSNGNARVHMSHPTTISCSRPGRPVTCENLELLRLRVPLPGQPDNTEADSGTVLISHGAVLPAVSEIMTGMNIIQSSKNELIVSVPRTHHYYGQYKCRCQADDTISSTLDSPPTQLTSADFDLDFVFQRNYTALNVGELVPDNLGFLELRTDEDAFFRLLIEGHSLTDKLELNVTYAESGNMTSVTGEYARTTVTEAFPLATDAKHAWPIPAYKVSLQEAWPDIADDEEIYVKWKTTDADDNVRTLSDNLRTVVLTPENENTVRAWTWQRDASILDMRAHYQIPQDTHAVGSKRIYLQRSGCSPAIEPEKVSTVVLSSTECQSEHGADKAIVKRTARGCAVQFKIRDPSSSDQYAIFVKTEDGTEDKQLAVAPGMSNNLQSEIDTTDISMKFFAVDDKPDSDKSHLSALVTIHSKAIVDSIGCRSMYLTLHPTWPVDQELEKRVDQSDTVFDFVAPRDQKLLVFDLELRVDEAGPDSPELRTRRSLTIPHPMAYQLELNVNKAKGEVTWSSLPAPFIDLLKEFHVKVTSLIRACGTQVDLQTPAVHEEAGDPATYRIRLDEIPDVVSSPKLLADYEVSVTPIFKSKTSGPVSGAASTVKFPQGQIGQTKIRLQELVTSRERRVFISPGQTASCLQDASFTVNHELKVIGEGENKIPAYLEQVTFEPDPNSPVTELGRWYVLKNLQPGRRYELKATVQYVTGEKDRESTAEQFWTKDEITISAEEQVVSPGQHVSVDCIATVGPSNPKRAEWRRSDGSPLPDGGRTELVSEANESNQWRQTVRLVFDKVELGQATTYSCFVEPSVEHAVGVPIAVPKFRLVVSEMELDVDSKIATAGETVQVRCHSQQADELIWLDPNGQTVPMHDDMDETATEPYATVASTTTSGTGRTAVLHIPRVTYPLTGDYICRHPSAKSDREFRLRMKQEIHLMYDETSSTKSGEALKLKCSAKSGQRGQQLVWYKRSERTDDARWLPVSGLINEDPSIQIAGNANPASGEIDTELTVINSPATNTQFGCALEPTIDEARQPLQELPETSATLSNVVQPVLRLKKLPSENSREVTVQCQGYPAHSVDRLQWLFLPEGNEPDKAVPIGSGMSAEHSENAELIAKLKSSFRVGENLPATWPGSTGPRQLALAGKIVASNPESASATPEQLDLILAKPDNDDDQGEVDEQLRAGSVICQYRRPKSVVVMEGSIPMFAVPVSSDEAAGQDVLIQDLLPVSQLIDPTAKISEPDSQPPMAVAGSGLVSVGENNVNSTSDKNFAITRLASPLLTHLLGACYLLFWRLCL